MTIINWKTLSALLAALFAPAGAAAQTGSTEFKSPESGTVPIATMVREVAIPYRQFTLANGLRVVVSTDRKAPVVSVGVWYNVGSRFEPAGRTGLAHLFEHLMFSGSQNAPNEFSGMLAAIGATDVNGSTSNDRTVFFETVPTPALARALFLESDRMGYLLPVLDQSKLDRQRGVVQNEKRQIDNQPLGLSAYRVASALFPPGHPYAHQPIGSMADLDAASLATVRGWFADHYAPSNAVLVLAGDIDIATARPLVERYFGTLKRGPDVTPPPSSLAPLAGPKAETMHDRVAAVTISRHWVVPGRDDADSVALDIAARVLGDLASSRLDEVLVRQERLATRVEAANETMAKAGRFSITVVVRTGVDPAVAMRRLDAVLASFLANGPTADEVERAQATSLAIRINKLDSVGGFEGKGATLAEGALFEHDPGFFRTRLGWLAAQTPASVRQAAVRWLGKPAYTLTVLPGARDAYQEAKAVATVVPAAAEPTPPGTRGPLPPVGDIASLRFPEVRRIRLSNGIELAYAQRATIPLTAMVASFDAGIAADRPDRLGTQQLTLAMMRQGPEGKTATETAAATERLGASIQIGSTLDRTSMLLVVPSGNLPAASRLWADMIRRPAFRQEDLVNLKAQQVAQIDADKVSPTGIAQRLVPTLLYGPDYPYAKARGSGDAAGVAALTRADLVAYRQAWLRPDRLTLFVVSDQPLDAVRTLLEARFGDWRAPGEPGVKSFSAAPRPGAPGIVLVDRPGSPQSVILGAIPTELAGTQDLIPIEIANKGLGGGFQSRLNMDVREARHWSYGIGGRFDIARNAAPYLVAGSVQTDRTGPAIGVIRDDLADYLGAKPMTAAEFDLARDGATRGLAGSFETSADVIRAMQMDDMLGRPDDYPATLPGRYRALTLPQVNAALRRALDPTRAIWIVVADAATVRPQLESLGLPVRSAGPE